MSDAATPMMAQYWEIKERYKDALLFYRMGDFYELFFEDAKAAAEALSITLTKRGKHLGEDVAMCGVPVERAESYLLTLIRKGFRVAVCEQLENPAEAKKRGAKSVVKRDVIRLVTPGTLTEDALLDPKRANYLAAFAEVRGEGALAWTDLSTGELRVMPTDRAALGPVLARIEPREALLPEAAAADRGLRAEFEAVGATVTPLAASSFDSASGGARLKALFRVATLDGFAPFTRAELGALGAIADYVEMTQKGAAPLLRTPVQETADATMRLDAATRRSLELTRGAGGDRTGSLLAAIDRTITGAGARLLERRLAAAPTDPEVTAQRLNAVTALVEDEAARSGARSALRRTPDIDRALSRLAFDRGGPRDLSAIRDGLGRAADLAERLAALPPLGDVIGRLRGLEHLSARLEATLVNEPPPLARDGGFIAAGADEGLDAARRLRDAGRGVIAQMQAEYAAETQISSLKIRHNNVLGYFIETSAVHAERMLKSPLGERFTHRQTLANAVRFTTADLAELESRILSAGEEALAIELRLFAELRKAVLAEGSRVAAAATALAELDVSAGLAELAVVEDYVLPLVDKSATFQIEGGRHPVVEQALRARGEGVFVPNDCDLSGGEVGRIRLLTGPNMAGKSTYLRQNALITILAQMGSYVPARRAHVGVVDRLFSRVGAADDLARGRSTFMVEMVETAAILNQAGSGTLVILDEIGRGTATYDGLSIAWATLEHLHDVNRCRALFATHYHELTTLGERLSGLRVATMAVREWRGEVIFLHEVRWGAADRSYGVQVAKLAGLPPAVVARAREVLDALEAGEREGGARRSALIDDLPLFSAARGAAASAGVEPSPVEGRLREIAPDALSPREALSLVYELKALLGAR